MQVDGSLGPASTLSGPVYEIDAASGRLAGPNLFQSFFDFQINSGEAAVFTGPPVVQNILVRVTGTHPSRIDGAVIAEIAGANLFFMNPNGITLASGAGMSLDGSLLVTTADLLRFRDGAVFPARPDGAAVLSSEPVTGLGFRPSEFVARGANGPIRLHYPDFDGVVVAPEFWMSPGKTLAFIGGGIDVDRRTMLAPGGAVALLALNSPGEQDLDLHNSAVEFNTRTFTDHAALNLRNETTINVNGARAGLVTLRGRDILRRGAGINSSSDFTGDAGSVILRSAGSIQLAGGSSLAVTAQQSRAGRLQLTAARDLRLDGVQLSATSLLDGGSIELKAGNLILFESSQISASAGFDGGNILLDPPLIVLRNSSVTANSAAANAGLITIVAGGFLRSGSTVQATTPNKTTFQGQIEVTAPDSDLSGELVPLAGVFLHADTRLLENCAAVSLCTGSSFIAHGRGGLGLNP